MGKAGIQDFPHLIVLQCLIQPTDVVNMGVSSYYGIDLTGRKTPEGGPKTFQALLSLWGESFLEGR